MAITNCNIANIITLIEIDQESQKDDYGWNCNLETNNIQEISTRNAYMEKNWMKNMILIFEIYRWNKYID